MPLWKPSIVLHIIIEYDNCHQRTTWRGKFEKRTWVRRVLELQPMYTYFVRISLCLPFSFPFPPVITRRACTIKGGPPELRGPPHGAEHGNMLSRLVQGCSLRPTHSCIQNITLDEAAQPTFTTKYLITSCLPLSYCQNRKVGRDVTPQMEPFFYQVHLQDSSKEMFVG